MNLQINQQFPIIRKILREAKNVLVVSHEKPDGDSVGSSLAVYHYLRKNNLKSYCFAPDPLPNYLKFLPASFVFMQRLPAVHFDLVIALDYGRIGRLGAAANLLDKVMTVSIDHHLPHGQKGDINLIAPQFSSTAEIIHFFFKENKIGIDKDIATCLLCGIFTDTGAFRHVVTSSATLKAVSDLISGGADLGKIARATFQEKTGPSCKIWGIVLSRARYDSAMPMIYSWASFNDFRRTQASLQDLDGLPEILNTVSNAKFSLFLSEYESRKVYGSLRSEPFKKTDVSKIAKELGGGGHKYAAGFKMGGSLKEVLNNVRKVVKELGT